MERDVNEYFITKKQTRKLIGLKFHRSQQFLKTFTKYFTKIIIVVAANNYAKFRLHVTENL